MYNSPHFRVRTFTLACVLLISSGGLNLLYADNDPCYKNPKCPNPAKPRRGKARVPRKPISPPRHVASNEGGIVRKKPTTRKPRLDAPVVVGNQSFHSSGTQFGGLDTTLSLPGTSFNSPDPNPIMRTADIRNTMAVTPGNIVEAALQRGYELFDAGKHKEATKQFNEVLKYSPRDVRAYDGLGDVHMVKGRHSKAIEAYRKALDIAPQNTVLSDKLQRAIAIEKEQDKVNRDKWILALLEIGIRSAAAATTQSNNEQRPQFNRIGQPNQPKVLLPPKRP